MPLNDAEVNTYCYRLLIDDGLSIEARREFIAHIREQAQTIADLDQETRRLNSQLLLAIEREYTLRAENVDLKATVETLNAMLREMRNALKTTRTVADSTHYARDLETRIDALLKEHT